MTDFSYKWEDVSLTVDTLILLGNLDRSVDPENNEDIKQLQEEIRKRSTGKIIIIDLSDFGTWDTEGIAAIIGKTVEPLVKRNKAKIGFCGPKVLTTTTASGAERFSQLYEDANIKHKDVGTKTIPWESSVEATLKELTD